VGEQIQ